MRVYELKQCNRIRKATSVDLVSVLTNLFQFDCDFSSAYVNHVRIVYWNQHVLTDEGSVC